MSSFYQKQNKDSKYFHFNNFTRKNDVNINYFDTPNNTYNYQIDNKNTNNIFNDIQCLSEESQNISNSNNTFSLNQKDNKYQTHNIDTYSYKKAYNLKQNLNNYNSTPQHRDNYQNLIMNKNLNLKKRRANQIEYKISQIKSELSSINSDNLMLKEDIYKYSDMNKYLENEIKIQKEHNEALLNKNLNLNQENESLSIQLEQNEKELSELMQENENKHKLFDENQMNLEMKNEKVNNDYNELISKNNKIKNDYDILCINYEKLNKKKSEINNEIGSIKEIQNKQFIDIEDKIKAIINEIEILKNEKKILIRDNLEKKNKFEIINKEKEDLYNKYQEQIIINDNLKKQLYNNKIELNELKKNLNEKKEKKVKAKTRPNSSNKRKIIIKDLQKKIEDYKYKSLKSSYSDDFSF